MSWQDICNCRAYLIGFPFLKNFCSMLLCPMSENHCIIHFVHQFSCLKQEGKSSLFYAILARSRNYLLYCLSIYKENTFSYYLAYTVFTGLGEPDIDAPTPLQGKSAIPGVLREHQKKKMGQTSVFPSEAASLLRGSRPSRV